MSKFMSEQPDPNSPAIMWTDPKQRFQPLAVNIPMKNLD